jgi:hypothetical protein
LEARGKGIAGVSGQTQNSGQNIPDLIGIVYGLGPDAPDRSRLADPIGCRR